MTENEGKGLVFDWHAQAKLDRDSLLVWLVITGLGQSDIERLSQLTDQFTNCHLTMYLNGVELNTKAFVNGLAHNIEHAVQKEVSSLVSDIELEQVEEALNAARWAVRRELTSRLALLGITMHEED